MDPSHGGSLRGPVCDMPQTPSPSEATKDVNPTLGRFVKVLDALDPSVESFLGVAAYHAQTPNNATSLFLILPGSDCCYN